MRNITDEEKLILAHGIVEVDSWLARTNGSEFEGEIDRLLEKFTPLYESEKDNPDYKTAAEKAEIERVKMIPATPVKSAEEKLVELIDARIAASK